MRFKCLVMDHDDTTVNSTATIHFPSFLAYLKLVRPEASYTLEEIWMPERFLKKLASLKKLKH